MQEAKAKESERAQAEFTAGTVTFHEAREIQGKAKLPCKDFVVINLVPVHVDDLDDYIAAMSGKVINPPPPPQHQLPSPGQTTVTPVDETIPDIPDENTPPTKPKPPVKPAKAQDDIVEVVPYDAISRDKYRELLRLKR